MTYAVDPARQTIADSWPNSMDDSAARAEWDWAPQYGLNAMTVEMLAKLGERFGIRTDGNSTSQVSRTSIEIPKRTET